MLIGCGQWAITLGRFGVTIAMFSAASRQGHVARMLWILGYLKGYWKYGITIDVKERVLEKLLRLK